MSEISGYVQGLKDTGQVSEAVALKAEVIAELLQLSPDVGVGPNGELMLTWDNPLHHLEIELLPNGEIEAYYRERK